MIFYFRISQNKLTNLIKFYQQHGLVPRLKRCGGRVLSKGLLTVQDVQRVKQFITNFADVHAMSLPGRIPGFKRSDIQVLPTTETMTSVWRRYKGQMRDHGMYCILCSLEFANVFINSRSQVLSSNIPLSIIHWFRPPCSWQQHIPEAVEAVDSQHCNWETNDRLVLGLSEK